MWKLTDKQEALAAFIYEMTGHKWEGGNPADFSKYVTKWRAEAEKVATEIQLQHEAEMDMIDAGRDW